VTDPAIIEAAVRALQDSGDEAIRAIDAQFYAAVVLTAITPLIEAAALEKAAKAMEEERFYGLTDGFAAKIRALKQEVPLVVAEADTLEQAKNVLRNWLTSYVEKYCDPVPKWKPQPDLLGMLLQADNASTVTGVFKARAEACEKREAAALEKADKVTDAMIDAAIHNLPTPMEIDMADRDAFGTMVYEILKARRTKSTVEWEARIFDPQGHLKPLRDWKPED
jgi:hypothetical protein